MDKVHDLLKEAFDEAKRQGVILKDVEFIVNRYVSGFYCVNVEVKYEGQLNESSSN